MSDGRSATGTPASANAATLLSGVPVLPEMIAPACPKRFPLRRRSAADERNDRLVREILFDERRGVFFIRAADLAGDHERVRLWIARELAQAVDERRADDRIAADADAGRLTQARAREPVDDLIRQRSRARDQPDISRRRRCGPA
jgi:hypothetical protein